jgi:hypothetical protein
LITETILGTDFFAHYKVEFVEGTPLTNIRYDAVAHHAEFRLNYSAAPIVVTRSGQNYATGGGNGKGAQMPSVKMTGALGPDLKNFLIANGAAMLPFTLVLTNGTKNYALAGCRVRAYSVSGVVSTTAESSIRYSLDIEGSSFSMAALSGVTFADLSPGFTNWSDLIIGLGGTATEDAITWRKFEFKVMNALDFDYDQSGARTAIVTGPRKHEGSIEYVSPVTIGNFEDLIAANKNTIAVSTAGLALVATDALFKQLGEVVRSGDVVTRALAWRDGGQLVEAASIATIDPTSDLPNVQTYDNFQLGDSYSLMESLPSPDGKWTSVSNGLGTQGVVADVAETVDETVATIPEIYDGFESGDAYELIQGDVSTDNRWAAIFNGDGTQGTMLDIAIELAEPLYDSFQSQGSYLISEGGSSTDGRWTAEDNGDGTQGITVDQ